MATKEKAGLVNPDDLTLEELNELIEKKRLAQLPELLKEWQELRERTQSNIEQIKKIDPNWTPERYLIKSILGNKKPWRAAELSDYSGFPIDVVKKVLKEFDEQKIVEIKGQRRGTTYTLKGRPE